MPGPKKEVGSLGARASAQPARGGVEVPRARAGAGYHHLPPNLKASSLPALYARAWTDEHGLLHRDDGPAVEYDDGDKEWWLHGDLVNAEVRGHTVIVDEANDILWYHPDPDVVAESRAWAGI